MIDIVLCLPLPIIRLLVVYLAPLFSLGHLVPHALLPLAALDAAAILGLLDPVVPSEVFPERILLPVFSPELALFISAFFKPYLILAV